MGFNAFCTKRIKLIITATFVVAEKWIKTGVALFVCVYEW